MYHTLTSHESNQARLIGPWCSMNNQKVNSNRNVNFIDVACNQITDLLNELFYRMMQNERLLNGNRKCEILQFECPCTTEYEVKW